MMHQYSLLILSSTVFCLVLCDVPLGYSNREGLSGHMGAFASLNWSDYELNLISSLHATGNYHEIMKMVKDKLVESEDLPLGERRKIENLLKKMRPPPLFKNLLDEEDTNRVRIAHGSGDLQTVLQIIDSRLRELPKNLYEVALTYLADLSPKYEPEQQDV
ncbi:unnamed protein product [Caenorhabditis angaria]|uniref:SXP/RAL-2 family protein Ani s 5-like cation-binding domain-containing protein n=1 Tax=Caenorhabditis angaria TaxID=860376 RepID=A0A9P1I848_9PELO|nr:unnamed protein product [Caenorhabditis angaria]